MPVEKIQTEQIDYSQSPVKQLLKRYEYARQVKDQWLSLIHI